MESFLEEQLAGSISYYDSTENFYHGYLMGILSGLEGYDIHSNKERIRREVAFMLSLQEIIDSIIVVAQEYPIKRAELFGSYANGKSTSGSDVDILLEFMAPHASLLMINSIKYRLEELLETNVDIVHGPLPDGSMIEIDRRILLYGA